ncbi:16S rRNA (uracil(1498)-N(3))-methyltransferase [Candidatus Poribacteria bacterium]|nr:16S rRNA (uracil(1498)-N(3))-methyltransferase [Candidatus Poribacteria bacterium]
MHTFYAPPPQIHTDTAIITDAEHHHLRNVLRMTPGETVRIIDGQGNVYTADVRHVGTKNASSEVRILSHEFHPSTLPSMTLFQGLPKNDKMALILQKTTEIGVTQIVPLRTEYALQKPGFQNRHERWHRIVIAATKQCKRTWLPELCEPQTYEVSLTQLDKFSLCLILNPHLAQEPRPQHIKTVLREISQPTSIALFVGPESGFSDQEVTAAIENGCIPVTLGANILRTETAAIVAVAAIAYEYQTHCSTNC